MTTRYTSILSCLVFALAGCGSEAPADVDSGTGPGMDSGMSAMDSGTDSGSIAPDSGSTTPDSGDVVDGGASDGGAMAACTNAADTAALDAVDEAMIAEDCGRTCFGGSRCVRDCMVDMAGVSLECATCFGETAQCTARNCALRCSGGDTPECTMCRMEAGCISAFESCSGLSGTSG